MAGNEEHAVSQEDLKVLGVSGNCGNDILGPDAVVDILEAVSSKKADLIVFNGQETNFKRSLEEITRAIIIQSASQLASQLASQNLLDSSNEDEVSAVTAILERQFSNGQLNVDDCIPELKARLSPSDNLQAVLQGMLTEAAKAIPQVKLTRGNMVTMTKAESLPGWVKSKIDKNVQDADGLCQLIIYDPSEITVRFSNEEDMDSPRVNRRSQTSIAGPSFNKGFKKDKLIVDKKGNRYILDIRTGHLESKGPAEKGRSKRSLDMQKGYIPQKQVLGASMTAEQRFNKLLKVASNASIDGYDANTRPLVHQPRLGFVQVEGKEGNVRVGLIETSAHYRQGIGCFSTDIGRCDPSIYPLLQLSPAGHRYGGPKTFHEKKKSKFTGNDYQPGDVDQSRADHAQGGIDFVVISGANEDLPDDKDAYSEDNKIGIEDGSNRDHDIIKSPVLTISPSTDFERVRSYIQRSLQSAWPELDLSSLNDDEEGYNTLINIYQTYLDKGGLLDRRLTLHAEKLACADRLRDQLIEQYQAKAKELWKCEYEKFVSWQKGEGVLGTEYDDERGVLFTPETMDDIIQYAARDLNEDFGEQWELLKKLDSELLFAEIYQPTGKTQAWFAGAFNADELDAKIQLDEAKLFIDQQKADIMLRLFSSPQSLIQNDGISALVGQKPDTDNLTKDQQIYLSTKALYEKTRQFIIKCTPEDSFRLKPLEKIWQEFNKSIRSAISAGEVKIAFNVCIQAIKELENCSTKEETSTLNIKLVKLLDYNHRIVLGQRKYSANGSEYFTLATNLLSSMHQAVDADETLQKRLEAITDAQKQSYCSDFANEKFYADLWQPIEKQFQSEKSKYKNVSGLDIKVYTSKNMRDEHHVRIRRAKLTIWKDYYKYLDKAKSHNETLAVHDIYKQSIEDLNAVDAKDVNATGKVNDVVDNSHQLLDFSHLIHAGGYYLKAEQHLHSQKTSQQEKVLGYLKSAIVPVNNGEGMEKGLTLEGRMKNFKEKCVTHIEDISTHMQPISNFEPINRLYIQIKKLLGIANIQDKAYEIAVTQSPKR